jgi:hypothetical protein
MAVVRGMGPCGIPRENGLPCGRQIQDGEPVGTITQGTVYNPQSTTGHKACADAFHQRVQQRERERNMAMVQRINQSGPGGAVNPNDAYDAVQGSIPLAKAEEPKAPGTIVGDMSNGAHFLGDLPEDASPAEAVQYAQGEKSLPKTPDFSQYGPPGVPLLPQEGPKLNPNPPAQVSTAYQGYAKGILGDPLPRVDAQFGRVVLGELHIRPDGTLHLDPEDAEDLIDLLRVNAKRAKRQT